MRGASSQDRDVTQTFGLMLGDCGCALCIYQEPVPVAYPTRAVAVENQLMLISRARFVEKRAGPMRSVRGRVRRVSFPTISARTSAWSFRLTASVRSGDIAFNRTGAVVTSRVPKRALGVPKYRAVQHRQSALVCMGWPCGGSTMGSKASNMRSLSRVDTSGVRQLSTHAHRGVEGRPRRSSVHSAPCTIVGHLGSERPVHKFVLV